MSDLFKFKFQKSGTSVADASANARPVTIETSMKLETFVKMRELIYKFCGIYYTDSKKYLLEGRISKRLPILKMTTFDEYYNFISSSVSNREELNQLFIAVTINETYFFRAEQQFDGLEKILIPEIIKRKRLKGEKVFKIWSAASSSGEEAYTLAIIIKDRIQPLFPGIDFQIIATDINTNVLDAAKKGIYKEYSVRNIKPTLLKKYFKQDGNNFILDDSIRSMVKFQQLNLYDTFAMRNMKDIDVIFCCNVLIYFDTISKQKVVQSLYDSLSEGGYLYIGYSESLHGITKSFKLIHLDKAMVYKKLLPNEK